MLFPMYIFHAMVAFSSLDLSGGGRSGREVLLELMLLDADVSLPRDEYEMKLASTVAASGGRGGNEHLANLMVLVSRAENLPMVRG